MTDLATPEESPEDSDTDGHTRPRGGVPRGLHAKVFVWDEGATSHVLTGSANCTGAAFGGNVEMSVLLSGPRATCGVEALLGDDKSGLLRITETHRIAEEEPGEDPAYELERRVEEWQVALAASRPVLRVTENGDDFDLRLELMLPPDPYGLGPTTTVKPVAVAHAPVLPITEAATWSGVALHALTPYLVVTTEADVDGVAVRRSCLLVCEVDGAPEDRHRRLLRDILANQQDVLRYLMLLLGDIGAQEMLDEMAARDAQKGDGGAFGRGFDDLVLLEPLLRASARGDESLARAHRLLEDLRDDSGGLPQLDEEFQRMWQIVWEGGRA